MSASREKRKRIQEKAGGEFQNTKVSYEQQQAHRRNVITVIVTVVVLLLLWLFISGSGLVESNLAAVTIGNVKISVAEFNFHYFNSISEMYTTYESYGWLDYLGFDPNKSLKSQAYDENQSWADYFRDEAISSLKSIVAQSEAARAENLTLTSEQRESLDTELANIEANAKSNNKSATNLLEDYFGKGISLKNYEKFRERVMLAQIWQQTYYDSQNYSDADLDAYYTEHIEDYDYLDYHSFAFPAVPDDETQDAAAYDASQKSIAETMLSKVTTSEEFYALSLKYTPSEEEEEDSEDSEDAEEDFEDTTLQKGVKMSSISEELGAFLLAEGRKAGDKAVVKVKDEYLVVLYLNRYRDDYNTVNVRHILIPFDSTAKDKEANKAEAQTLSEQTYNTWKSGTATEDAFAALANEKSTDTGSNTNGGLYENVYKGYMVTEFNDWIFDPSRKPGDTGIVETTYGCHIMYFSGFSTPYWKLRVEADAKSAALQARSDELVEQNPESIKSFGMFFAR